MDKVTKGQTIWYADTTHGEAYQVEVVKGNSYNRDTFYHNTPHGSNHQSTVYKAKETELEALKYLVWFYEKQLVKIKERINLIEKANNGNTTN